MPPLRFIHLFLFALALLFAQQGAALHTLRHVFAEQVQSQDKQIPHTQDCEQCTTYAQLGSALNNHHFSFDFYLPLAATLAANSFAFLTQHTVTATARGPPVLQSLI